MIADLLTTKMHQMDADLNEQINNEIIENLENKTNKNSYDKNLLNNLKDHQNEIISKCNEKKWRIPSYISKTSNAECANEIQGILFLIRDINNDLVGISRNEAGAIIKEDPFTVELYGELVSWAKKYCIFRINKPNSKDDGKIFSKYIRIYEEVSAIFEPTSLPTTITYHFSFQILEFTSHFLYKNLLKKYISFQIGWNSCRPKINLPNTKYNFKEILRFIENEGFYHEDIAQFDYNYISQRLNVPSDITSLNTIQKKQRMKELAENINEMKPFLIKSAKHVKSIIRITDDLYFGWTWGVLWGIGAIMLENSHEKIIDVVKNLPMSGAVFAVEIDGTFSCSCRPWIDAELMKEYGIENALDINLYLLQSIHDKLFSFYCQIDLDTILWNWKNKTSHNHTDEEIISSSCQLKLTDADTDPETKLRNPVVKKIRKKEFFNILIKLNCTVTKGKGSEIKIFRPGGKIYIVGNHKRNNYIPVAVIINILKRLEISLDDWMDAVA